MNLRDSVVSSSFIGGPQRDRTMRMSVSEQAKSARVDLVTPKNRTEVFSTEDNISTEGIGNKARINELQKQVSSLKDTVQRLSNELARYQTKYTPTTAKEFLDLKDHDIQPWFYDSEIMNPLLVAYDAHIRELETENREQLESTEANLKIIIKENDDLHQKQKQVAMQKLQQADYGVDDVTTHAFPTQEWREAQERLVILAEENKLLSDEQVLLNKEIDRLREENRQMHENCRHNITIVDNTTHNDSDNTKKLFETAKKALEQMTSQFEVSKKQFEKSNNKNKVLKKDLDEVCAHIEKINEVNDALVRELNNNKILLEEYKEDRKKMGNLENTISSKDNQLSGRTICGFVQLNYIEHTMKINQLTSELDANLKEKQSLYKELSQLEQRLATQQQSEFDAIERAKDLLENLENIRVDRDNIKSLAETRKNEVDRLEEKLQVTSANHVERCKQIAEVSVEKSKDSVRKLEEELRVLESDNRKLKLDLEKAQREKKDAESRMEKIVRSAETEQSTPSLLNELNKKLSIVSVERDEAESKYEEERLKLRRHKLQWEQDREQLNVQLNETAKKIIRLDRESADRREQHDRISRELDRAQKQLQQVQSDKEDEVRTQKEKQQEVISFHSKQVEELKSRLDDSNARLTRSESKLTSTTQSHDKMKEKWSAEMRALQENVDKVIYETKQENDQLQKRNEYLERKKSTLEREKDDARRAMDQLTSQLTNLEASHSNERRRADYLASQIKSLMSQQGELIKEKKEMSVTVDRINLELKREKRINQSQIEAVDKLRQTAPARWTAPERSFEDEILAQMRLSRSKNNRRSSST
ncbi:89 kDa centrosomal protein, partial [Acrasis kona]